MEGLEQPTDLPTEAEDQERPLISSCLTRVVPSPERQKPLPEACLVASKELRLSYLRGARAGSGI